jgi:hypothetical protein
VPGPAAQADAQTSFSALAIPALAAQAQAVVRPEPGLARGVWEAPPWVFVALLAAAAVAALAWAATALLRRRATR